MGNYCCKDVQDDPPAPRSVGGGGGDETSAAVTTVVGGHGGDGDECLDIVTSHPHRSVQKQPPSSSFKRCQESLTNDRADFGDVFTPSGLAQFTSSAAPLELSVTAERSVSATFQQAKADYRVCETPTSALNPFTADPSPCTTPPKRSQQRIQTSSRENLNDSSHSHSYSRLHEKKKRQCLLRNSASSSLVSKRNQPASPTATEYTSKSFSMVFTSLGSKLSEV